MQMLTNFSYSCSKMSSGRAPLRYGTWNIQSAPRKDIKFVITQYMRRENLSILWLTETKIKGETLEEEWGWGISFVGIGAGTHEQNIGGVGFAYVEADCKIRKGSLALLSNRLCHAVFEPGHGCPAPFVAICAYAQTQNRPNPEATAFFQQLHDEYRKLSLLHPRAYTYIADDFNCSFGTDATATEIGNEFFSYIKYVHTRKGPH